MRYFSTKTWSPGFSCSFRQHKADSHCHFLHGYALKVKLVFIADNLDSRNWVMDFGGLADVKHYIENTFDHKTLVAHNDPFRSAMEDLATAGVIDLRVVKDTGCEAFALMIRDFTQAWLRHTPHAQRVQLTVTEVFEHESNSAGITG
jgi:6-pyruvoyltetrahydropterin/6-carboxytetrahydropterin synthase